MKRSVINQTKLKEYGISEKKSVENLSKTKYKFDLKL